MEKHRSVMKNHSNTFDPRLNAEILYDLYEDDMDEAIIVFDQFLNMGPSLMKEMNDEYNKGSVETFRQKVHKMKPVFGYVGLMRQNELAETLEKKCKEISRISEIDDLYRQLQILYNEGLSIIRDEVKRLDEQLN